ncbi:MAG TPA: pyruvate:ferredoxin (flavodoxin) oxidoreductase [Gammaproteobacteria bacterium]|nr:pyruvate:ferredoxin (flavodoxin) oxidoreductase [Gammaproteobacteria bacterium]
MTVNQHKTLDGNEACAYVAHKTNEVIAIYPITPASPMGEHADHWSAQNVTNIWGTVPHIIEMQSEGGAAGTIHGSLQAGALTTTFTASQGLLLMLPNMYKIAGELTPTVFHVAARSVATQALSIFCDHSDVMAARATGFAMLVSNNVQETLDFALIAQSTTLLGRIPILHFFDGFRTSHEVSKIDVFADEVIEQMVDSESVLAFRRRALNPNAPVIRGTSQNPDVFFQARETVNPYYDAFCEVLQLQMDRFAALSGRQYQLYEYIGDREATRVVVIMGSAADAVQETVEALNLHGEKVGVLKVRLFRPFCGTKMIAALPKTVHSIAVLDRTKEPGAEGEPLYKDVITALMEDHTATMPHLATLPKVIGGRFGLASKEFTPGMIKSIYDELATPMPKNHFTVGIYDDLQQRHLQWDERYRNTHIGKRVQCVFYGLGSDGTVSANKNSIKIIGEETDYSVQGYFVYDSKKSGAVTVSHLRFSEAAIRSSYLIGQDDADFIACHQQQFLMRYDMLSMAKPHATFLLNSEVPADKVWNTLPASMQQQILDKDIQFYCIDAYQIARKFAMGNRINTIMQTCFFAIIQAVPIEQAVMAIKQSVQDSYGRKGRAIVRQNHQAIDAALDQLHQVPIPGKITSQLQIRLPVAVEAPEFVQQVTGEIIAGRGDQIPVSQFPADGSYPLGTAAYEKRHLTNEIPVVDYQLCTHCGKCAFVCPHGVIRSKAFPAELAAHAPAGFEHVPIKGKDYPEGMHISYQVSAEDCTGCTLCVDICPIRDKSQANYKAINMAPLEPVRAAHQANWTFFLQLPDYDRQQLKLKTIKGSMLGQPLFEFSGACSGCGETPYIKLATQLFGDRMLVANATGCSSIYGGNLPTTPWAKNQQGRGPAWNNSLFEDNAEFGLGMRLAIDKQQQFASELLIQLKESLDTELVDALLHADQADEAGIHQQRLRVNELQHALQQLSEPLARRLETIADSLCKRSVWIIGGDGWAYDIGFGGLDHVLASGKDVNILVLDTEVYSNTGGQTSKATPRGAVAKFSAAGKDTAKKDLARIAMDYEHVYVAHVAYGSKDVQTLHAFIEAESFQGPSLIIAYAPCIAHGVDLKNNHKQQQLAVESGHWPLFRFDPRLAAEGKNPLHLDSKPPSIPYREFVQSETRFSMLWRAHPERAEEILQQSQQEVRERFYRYQQLAALSWEEEEHTVPHTESEEGKHHG